MTGAKTRPCSSSCNGCRGRSMRCTVALLDRADNDAVCVCVLRLFTVHFGRAAAAIVMLYRGSSAVRSVLGHGRRRSAMALIARHDLRNYMRRRMLLLRCRLPSTMAPDASQPARRRPVIISSHTARHERAESLKATAELRREQNVKPHSHRQRHRPAGDRPFSTDELRLWSVEQLSRT